MTNSPGEDDGASITLAARVDACGVPALFERLVSLAAEAHPALDCQHTLGELLDREKNFPTALGHGIAIPHAHVEGLKRRMRVVALCNGGIDFAAPDEQPVRLVFLLLSSANDPEGHLTAMAEIARMMCNPQTRQRILSAADEAEILAALKSP